MTDEATRGWSVEMRSVQTGHGYFETARCLVFECERGFKRLVACALDGELRHADTYEPYRSIPLAALQLLLEAEHWRLTPSQAEMKHRKKVHERFERRLRDDPKFAEMIAAAEARGGKGEQT